ncbi:MAG: hypothetical protein U1G07_06845 [Verrucomicrobiota bacterium]
MKKLCAWCGKRISGRGRVVTHGICPPCYRAMFQAQFDFFEHVPKTSRPRHSISRRSLQGRFDLAPAVQADFDFFDFGPA